ncbi:MgtC/SapB family protein [Hydrogenovibrio halophilus]|uniref:MgtC/SapB family protein n=1 Tax=Hydrogenovibrio halophilus TaxID=373391 RepID=UPI00035C9C6B|nr:MgtC/SapB family protein [Hydrogenovibrio halophilus]
MTEFQQLLYPLGVALAIGLLIGTERGWQNRETRDGGRIAGVRTFGLVGLLGGLLAIVDLDHWVIGLAFVALAGVMTSVYALNLRQGDDVGITTLIATLVTFMLGVLAGMGDVLLASATAVVVTLLLTYKPALHRGLARLQPKELHAALKLLLISVVLLPILPNQGYGPYQALNPYEIWWMVVVIAAISFVGYSAIKIGGARKGAVFTGLFGGLAASTAVTLHFSRLTRTHSEMGPMLATGILIACGTMFPRMLLVASALSPALFYPLWLPALVMAILTYLPAVIYWRAQAHQNPIQETPLRNPLELKTALAFGLLLTLVMLLGQTLRDWFGDAGILALAAASGVADVDAITLSLARMSQEELGTAIAATGIVIAAAVNNLVKGSMAASIGGRQMLTRVALPLWLSGGIGLITTWLWVWA